MERSNLPVTKTRNTRITQINDGIFHIDWILHNKTIVISFAQIKSLLFCLVIKNRNQWLLAIEASDNTGCVHEVMQVVVLLGDYSS